MTEIFPKIDTVILRVRDLQKSRRWYEDKLGLVASFIGEKEPIVVFKIGNTPTSLTIYEVKKNEKPPIKGETKHSWPIFYSEDIKKSHETLRNKDVKVDAIEGDSESQWFSFYDPDGNRLEACHY